MEAITNVKVGFKTYKIEKPMEIVEVDGEYSGTCSYTTSTIKLADKLEQVDKNQVFWHELLHCICKRFALVAFNEDEQSIDLLATGIYELIKDNPHIFTMRDI